MHKLLTFATLLSMVLLIPQTVKAGEPRLLGTHEDWAAYVFFEDSNKVCYMASQPKEAKGDYTKRDEVFALITHRPAEGTKDVFSYITGYSYEPGSDTILKIDDKRFVLFTQDDTGWAPDSETDAEIAKALKAGSKMTVEGTSSRGTKTTDTFSLKGSTAAHKAITEECGS